MSCLQLGTENSLKIKDISLRNVEVKKMDESEITMKDISLQSMQQIVS
jgi:hypothetical protein